MIVGFIEGFLSTRWFRVIKPVALDGFYKYPDETVAELPEKELWEFCLTRRSRTCR
jgi:hypothetical protein